LLQAQEQAMRDGGDNAGFTRDVGYPLAQAIQAFGAGDYGRAVALLSAVRPVAHRFGGSHAQRDVIELTLIEAALRGGQTDLAAPLTAERAKARPDSPLSQLFVGRAAAMAAARA
jgi:hypothetical protein